MSFDTIYGICVIGIIIRVFWGINRGFTRGVAPTKRATTPKDSKDSVTAYEIPKIVKELQQSANDGNFVVFIFVPPKSRDGQSINLQYSIEDGVVGFDWVLISPCNIADQAKIKEFATTLGHRLKEYEMNNTRYLRATGDYISDLGKSIIKDVYKMDLNTKLDIVIEGFAWPPHPAP
jgi:hypothetical protein